MIDELTPLGQHQRHGRILVARPMHQQRHEAGGRQRRIAHHRLAHRFDTVRIGGRQKTMERRLGAAPAHFARIVARAVGGAVALAGRRAGGRLTRRTETLEWRATQRDARRGATRFCRELGGMAAFRRDHILMVDSFNTVVLILFWLSGDTNGSM